MIEELKLNIIVSDSGYNKKLPADCILAQNPGQGTNVKEGHTVYVTVNSPSSPSFPIPDVPLKDINGLKIRSLINQNVAFSRLFALLKSLPQ